MNGKYALNGGVREGNFPPEALNIVEREIHPVLVQVD